MTTSKYLKEMYERFKMLPSWLPNAKFQIGDVGILKERNFQYVTNLKNLHIHFESRSIGSPADLEGISQSGAKISIKGDGNVPNAQVTLAQGKANVLVEFQEEGGFIFQASGCQQTVIEDRARLSDDILAAYQEEEWKPEWVVIDSLMKAKYVTVLISDSKESHMELSATGKIAHESLPLADANASFSIVSQSGSITRILGAVGVTPLFQASRMRKSIFNPFSTPSLATTSRNAQVKTAPGAVQSGKNIEIISLDDFMR